MELRKQRTLKNIKGAFMELRKRKSLEKITIKELAELAMINKATFYCYYMDIYDLSEQLEDEFIKETLNSVPCPDKILIDAKQFSIDLALAFESKKDIVNILFSDNRKTIMINKVENLCKTRIYTLHPEYKNNIELDILFTVLIQGCFRASITYSNDMDNNQLINILANICESTKNQLIHFK